MSSLAGVQVRILGTHDLPSPPSSKGAEGSGCIQSSFAGFQLMALSDVPDQRWPEREALGAQSLHPQVHTSKASL